jgi:porin
MTYASEVFANVSGGMKQGPLTTVSFCRRWIWTWTKLLGWRGTSFRVSMIQGHGPSLSSGWVGNIMGVSGVIAVPPATRLYNLWLEQQLFGDLLSVRAGIMNVDAEFLTSETASLFMNTTSGWPDWLGVDLLAAAPPTRCPAQVRACALIRQFPAPTFRPRYLAAIRLGTMARTV